MDTGKINRLIAEECFGCCKECIENAVKNQRFTKSINHCVLACEKKGWCWEIKSEHGIIEVMINGEGRWTEKSSVPFLFAKVIAEKIQKERETYEH